MGLEDDPEQKIVEDSQEKDYLPEFQLDEELGDGDMEQDILLEGEEEGENDANDEGDDEEADDEDVEEIEEKVDDGDIKQVEEAVAAIKLEADNGDDTLQDDNDDEVESMYITLLYGLSVPMDQFS